MTEKTQDRPASSSPSDAFQERLLEAMLRMVPERGWTAAAMEAGREAAGLTHGQVMLACPNGVRDMLEAFAQRAADAAEDRLRQTDLSGVKIREKVTIGIKAWLGELRPHKAAVKRAAGSPLNLVAGPKGLWATADAIWSGLGDRATDYNWYTKRITLSAVLGSTLLAWLASEHADEVDDFLARRIEDVMTFEKAKGRVREFAGRLPNPLDWLGKAHKRGA